MEEEASPTVFPTATCFKQRNEKYSEELHSVVFLKELYAKLSLLGVSLILSTKWSLSRYIHYILVYSVEVLVLATSEAAEQRQEAGLFWCACGEKLQHLVVKYPHL